MMSQETPTLIDFVDIESDIKTGDRFSKLFDTFSFAVNSAYFIFVVSFSFRF